jgi:hypothetical protein
LAVTPRDNEAFYREVDEEVRRDQLRTWWERYGKAGIAAGILLLAALAGYFWWQYRIQEAAGKQGIELGSAFEDIAARNKASALPKLDRLAKSESPGYRAGALLTKADLAVEEGNLPEATSIFRTVANDGKLDRSYRDLATMRMTALEFDKLKPQQVIDRLQPYAVSGNPWFGSAGEMVAISYLKLNKPRDAARIFAAMAKDQKVPDSIRSRAVQMAGSLGVDAIQDAAAATGVNKQ